MNWLLRHCKYPYVKFITCKDILAIIGMALLIAIATTLLNVVLEPSSAVSASNTFGFVLIGALMIILYRNLIRSIYQTSQSSKESIRDGFEAAIGNVQSLLYLQNKINIPSPLPLTGGWAASADFLASLDSEIRKRKPKLILELGCGVSTIICAQALKSIGDGRVISIDHSAEFAAKTAQSLKENGLGENSEIRVCPLKGFRNGEKSGLWYDTNLLSFEGRVDLLVVDGPPQVGLDSTRYPALPFLHERLAEHCIILVDDGRRSTEKFMVEAWSREFNLTSEYFDNAKGLFLIKMQ